MNQCCALLLISSLLLSMFLVSLVLYSFQYSILLRTATMRLRPPCLILPALWLLLMTFLSLPFGQSWGATDHFVECYCIGITLTFVSWWWWGRVLERMPGDKCHWPPRISESLHPLSPHAAEADCGSGWQMLLDLPVVSSSFFFFFHNVFISIHQTITGVHFKYLVFLLRICTSRKSSSKYYLAIFFLSCIPHCTLEPSHFLNSTEVVLRAENPHESLWNCSAQRGDLIPPIYSFIIYQAWQMVFNVCIR